MKLLKRAGLGQDNTPLLSTTAWNHNNHYHHFLLNQLPSSIDSALDIGCGHGDFAAHLAKRAAHVDAIDVDRETLNEARLRHSALMNLQFIEGDFLEQKLPLTHYNVITSIAAVHHMELRAVLQKVEKQLCPGGILVILGLYRATTIIDSIMDTLGVWTHFAYTNLIYRQRYGDSSKAVPMQDPSETLAEIRHIADGVVPGSQIRRHLLWRYSLIWRKPV